MLKLCSVLLLFSAQFSFTQAGINWKTFDEVMVLRKENPKPIFIDVFTEWCGWCKKLDQSTFMNQEVVNLVNKSFYAIKFDAEITDTLNFDGTQYFNSRYNSGQQTRRKPPHDLAVSFLSGKLSYPSMVVMDSDFQNQHLISGYKDHLSLLSYLLMYQGDGFKTTNVQEFEYYFVGAFKGIEGYQYRSKKKINWMSPEQAFKESAKDTTKQIFIQLYLEGNPICRVMDSVVFNNEIIIDQINANFYPVKMDVFYDQDFKIGDMEFKTNTSMNNINDFIIQLPRKGNQIQVPHTYLIKKEGVLTDHVSQFLTPRLMEVWLAFNLQKGSYPSISFQDFAKSFNYDVNHDKERP